MDEDKTIAPEAPVEASETVEEDTGSDEETSTEENACAVCEG